MFILIDFFFFFLAGGGGGAKTAYVSRGFVPSHRFVLGFAEDRN